MTRKNCRGCESDHVAVFLDLGDMPLAGCFLLNTVAIKNKKGIYYTNTCLLCLWTSSEPLEHSLLSYGGIYFLFG